jgi:hypothetical protein
MKSPVRLGKKTMKQSWKGGKKHRLIVVDQNVLRDRSLMLAAAERCRRDGLSLLLPDVAGFEFSKGSRQFETWRRSLERLQSCRDVLAVGRKLSLMLDEERANGRRCDTLVDSAGTNRIRLVLDGLVRRDDSSLRSLVDGLRTGMAPASFWQDSAQHLQLIVRMRDGLRSEMNSGFVTSLRRNPHSEMTVWLSSEIGARLVFQGIRSLGVSDVGSLGLSLSDSVLVTFVLALSALSIHWLAFGGFESASPGATTNDLLDVEYATLGSLSTELLTRDKRLKAIRDAVVAATASRQSYLLAKLRDFAGHRDVVGQSPSSPAP